MHKAPIHWTAASSAKCKPGSPPGNRVSMQSSTMSEFLRSCNVGPSSVSVNAQTDVFTSENLSNTSKIFGLGVRKIPNFGCIRPFVFSRTYMYMNAQQALRLINIINCCSTLEIHKDK